MPVSDVHGDSFPGAGAMHVDLEGNWGRGSLGTLPQGGDLPLSRTVQCGREQAVLRTADWEVQGSV